METIIDNVTALYSLGYSGFWGSSKNLIFPEGVTPPTQAEIDSEVIRLQAEYDAQEYARNRQAEYPSLLELTVALYDTDDKSAVEAKRASVKLKYPKPS